MISIQSKKIILIILIIFLGGCYTEALLIAPIPLASGEGYKSINYPPYEPITPQDQEQALKDIPLLVEEIKRKQSEKDRRVEKNSTVLNGTMRYGEQFATVGDFPKNVEMYKANENYKTGWDDGFIQGKEKMEEWLSSIKQGG
ncbi:MAG: hypothetical protein GY777_05680 [Candidatus Brocadiaceae bacterium]|nr:hypothetical protein [Candidatus Brocadiaceae bacterium]